MCQKGPRGHRRTGGVMTTSSRRRWTDETIETELTAVVARLGRMPTRRELTEQGLGGLWTARQRQGGLPAWRGRVTAEPAAPAALAAPSRDDVARRAYFIAL